MRLSSLAAAAALAAVSLSTSLSGQRPDSQIDARSMQLLEQARGLKAAGNLDGATDMLETAVTVDPRNRAAFILLAEVADARGLPGKAIRLYREALLLDPNDTRALRGQGEAWFSVVRWHVRRTISPRSRRSAKPTARMRPRFPRRSPRGRPPM